MKTISRRKAIKAGGAALAAVAVIPAVAKANDDKVRALISDLENPPLSQPYNIFMATQETAQHLKDILGIRTPPNPMYQRFLEHERRRGGAA